MDPSFNPHHTAKMPVREARQVLRQSLVLWLLGMPGVVALSLQLGHVLPGSTLAPELMSGMVAAQLALLLLGAVFIGAWGAPRLGIPMPLWQAWQAGHGQRWVAALWAGRGWCRWRSGRPKALPTTT